MKRRVRRLRWKNHQIVGCVVAFIAVYMVDDFFLRQMSAEHFLCGDSVFMSAVQFPVGNALAGIQLCHTQFFTSGCAHSIGIHFKIQLRHVFRDIGEILKSAVSFWILAFTAE